VDSIGVNPDFGMKSLGTQKLELQQYQEYEMKAKNLKQRLLKKLKDAKEVLQEYYIAKKYNKLLVYHSKALCIEPHGLQKKH